MAVRILYVLSLVVSAFLLPSCGDDPVSDASDADASERAVAARVRVLAIGNSFTDNATEYIPEILSALGAGDDVFFAKTVLGNSSLEQHWANHQSDEGVYGFYYAADGEWRSSGSSSFDHALTFADWDVIVIQQVSWLAGDTGSYQPYFDNIVRLLHALRSRAAIGWQMTWAYAPFTSHAEFYRYGCNYSIMYDNVTAATDEAAGGVDFVIPSGCMIDCLRGYVDDREIYSADGFHLRDGIGCFALSWLWHEMVVDPLTECGSGREDCVSAAAACGVNRDAANDIYDMTISVIQNNHYGQYEKFEIAGS